jgi:DNA-binding response OmpR family regulator
MTTIDLACAEPRTNDPLDPRAAHVLVVEDDLALAAAMSASLRDAGFQVVCCDDGIAACMVLQCDAVDAVVLDLDLRGMPGLDLLQRARQGDGGLPVIALGDDPGVGHRVHAIELGADDYLLKPVAPEDLVVRVRSLVRRRRTEAEMLLRAGRLEIDLRSHSVRADGTPVVLTGREFALLKLLVEAGGRTVPRPVLQERLGEWGEVPESNAVDVHVHRLRRKVGRENIHTFRGGYAVAA